MKKINFISPAKVNLTLEIIEKLPNGFHRLRSVMKKTENLFDEIEMVFDEKKKKIQILCTDKKIPTDKKNTCWKIAEKFFLASGKKVGITIKIKKNIPTLAGLGGGSSNAGGVLLALNQYFGNILNPKQLIQIAQEVGKDIPFFLQKEAVAYVTGAGEKLQSIEKFSKLNLLIINPLGEIGTGWAYGELDQKMWFMDNRQRKNLSQRMLKGCNSSENIGKSLYNDFAIVAQELFPVIVELKNCLLSLGAQGVSITGKGPTVIAIFRSKKEAIEIKETMRRNYPTFFVELA